MGAICLVAKATTRDTTRMVRYALRTSSRLFNLLNLMNMRITKTFSASETIDTILFISMG